MTKYQVFIDLEFRCKHGLDNLLLKYRQSVVIFLLSVSYCSAQEPAFKNYNDQNGLPSSEVYYVFEDHQGFIWFATDNGVVRFDGGEFRLFNKLNGLADAVAFSIFEDAKGDLWFRTFTGATSIYSKGKMKLYPYNKALMTLRGRKNIDAMMIDSLGQVYIANNGLYRINVNGGIDTIPIASGAVKMLQVTKNNFITGTLGLCEFVEMKGRSYKMNLRGTESAFVIPIIWRNKAYLLMSNILFLLEGNEAKPVLKSDDNIISLSVDRDDNLWVGFLGRGVVRYSNESLTNGWRVPLLSDRSVTSVTQDAKKGFWFSTLERGVYYLPDLKIINYNLPEDSKMNFALATPEKVLIGFYNGVLICLERGTKKKLWSLNLGRPIVAGVPIKDDNLLISTSLHSMIVSKNGSILKTHPLDSSIKSRTPKKFFKTAGRIWGLNAFGAREFDLSGNPTLFHPIAFWCRNIFINGSDVYLAGIAGLHKTDLSFKKIVELKTFVNDKVSDMIQLPGNQILVATVGDGMKIIDGEKVTAFSKKDGLLSDNIYSTAIDQWVWLGTEKGLLRVDLDLLLHKAKLSYDLLDKNSGLMNNKVNFISRFGNDTWCVHNDGFSIFDDRDVHFANKYPTPSLNQITVNTESVESPGLLQLTHDDNNLSFEFGFQSYNNRNIFLRHRATSLDPWNYSDDYTISYHSLAPGTYHFEVEYSTDKASWRKIEFPGTVVIKPVWWETIYFRLAILTVTALIFFIYFRSKYKSRLLKLEMAEKLKAEKERIAQDLHDNIGSKLVSLSLGLNQVVKQYDIASETAEMIYSNVNTTVTELRDTIWAIQKEGVTVAEFCDKIKNLVWRLRQNNGAVQYDLQIKTEQGDSILKPSQAINLHRIVQEAIANSQKHSNAKLVSISIFYDESIDRLYIKIEDNGKGFEVNSFGNEQYGLKNMRSRAEEIAALLEITSKIGEGTRIMISLPLAEKTAKD